MLKILLSGVMTIVLSGACCGVAIAEKMAEEMPSKESAEMPMEMMFPKPTEQHQWLQQFVGEWVAETEMYMKPGQQPEVSKGTETVESLGGFWTMSEIKGNMMNQPFTGVHTMGYDANKEKFVATWMDSSNGKLWQYDGQLDEENDTLTFETEGVCPMKPGKISKFKDVIKLDGKNKKSYTSYMQGDDGAWILMVKSQAQRIQ